MTQDQTSQKLHKGQIFTRIAGKVKNYRSDIVKVNHYKSDMYSESQLLHNKDW